MAYRGCFQGCVIVFCVLFLFLVFAGRGIASQPLVLLTPGPLLLASVSLSTDADVRVEVWRTQEEAFSRLATGEAAAAVLPATVGAVLSAKSDVVFLGAFRGNVFSLVVRNSSPEWSWEELKGKEILVAQGRGTVLDSILRSILLGYGLHPERDVRLLYAPAPETSVLYRQGKADIVALPEPFATFALEAGGRSFDPQEAWSRSTGLSARFPVGGVFAAGARVRENPGVYKKLTEKFSDAAAWFEENPEEACILAGRLFGMPPERFIQALPQIRVSFETAEECASDVSDFLSGLHDALGYDAVPPPPYFRTREEPARR